MNGITIMLISLAVLFLAYVLYGRWIAKKWGIDPSRKTPAYEQRDGVDYEPAPRSVVFGHQFASIAGAGPINGPIQAAIFGWVPVLLWVLSVVCSSVLYRTLFLCTLLSEIRAEVSDT